mmetsp:Transcript_5281/g.7768  ORF Transcript_5281/g.7768 Transcript_5281/m.7768 type:complete len:190 (-) Transcript_5281:208-777(-)
MKLGLRKTLLSPTLPFTLLVTVLRASNIVVLVRALTTSSPTFIPPKISHSLAQMSASADDTTSVQTRMESHVKEVLFIECGFGNDQHGQTGTKAAVRACRNAIEFNSIPSINRLVPGGYDALKLFVILAIPPKYQEIDLEQVAKVFPYGDVKFEIQDGGMVAPSGIAIEALGDKNQDMVVVCASVTVGY